MPRHILIKLAKIKHKERILKAAREKQQVTYKRNPMHLTGVLSAETLQAKREWQDIFKVLKGKYLQPRLLNLASISFKVDGEIKSFPDKQKLREFSTTKPSLQQMFKWTFIVKKYSRRKKKSTKSTPNNYKMAVGTYVSIITLNVNGLNAPTKRHRLAEWIQKQDPLYMLSTRNPLQT